MAYVRDSSPIIRQDQAQWIPAGRAGTRLTLEVMRDLARTSSQALSLRQLTAGLRNPREVDQFIRENWRLVPDPETAELIRTPERQAWDYQDNGHFEGDCDDAATLAASLLLVLGVPSIFVAIRMPYETDFSHVFLRVPLLGGVLDIDPIVPEAELPIQGIAETMEVYI